MARADEAPPPQSGSGALGALSLDELSEIKVTSVSKRAEPISQAPSSVYVITNDAIRRSGAISIPEALRNAPNLEVMRIDALDYSITARGFAGFEAANKLLVLIDGRSVYTPLFSGVDWDQNQVLLDDVDRIEVISGPGGTLWGANAVNGVVNITTRSAFDTQGSLAEVNLGSLDSDVRLRYGGQLGESAAGRIYFTAFRRGELRKDDGAHANDGWDGVQGGFRTDWAGDRDTLTLQGDAHDGTISDSLGLPGYVRGGNVLGRWTRRMENGSTVELQAYYDQFARNARLIHDGLKTYDIQAQHAFSWLGRHQIIWGGGYRITEDDFYTLTEPQLLTPTHRRVDIGNLFAQDEFAVRTDLTLTLGLKLETNTYTRAELMPNARLGWRVSDRQFLWAAVSRAVRNPSRIERDFSLPGIVDPGHMGSEKLIAYELGYRGRMTDAANVSVSLYYNAYDQLRTNDLSPGGVLPIYVGNSMEGDTYGIEAWADYDVRSWWRLSVGGSILGKDFRLKPGSLDIAQFEAAGVDPDYWVKLRSQMRLGDRVTLDAGLRYYDAIPTSQASGYVGAKAYLDGDLRLAWRVTDALELSLVGQNLLHDRHAEASESRRDKIQRSVLLGLRWVH
ncbi:TonB-dependent receptor plug domain-containing protein [Phenylobacterium hankyongense]|uniref:TonB-dependent receptor plug domain-containing protein n=1 Tax=Phenylobacterium hankyongense TaxID=1813876 RepID=UPI001402B24B|nr:TonB-dependent receptor [Phenylobacterium hankyongense]